MIQNYKITIAYDGSRYHGFEAKPDVDTIQGRIENVLSRMTDTRVMTVGAGRTDAGVHARAMVISCKLDTDMSEDDIMDYMNTYLPEDIGVIGGRGTVPCQVFRGRQGLSVHLLCG